MVRLYIQIVLATVICPNIILMMGVLKKATKGQGGVGIVFIAAMFIISDAKVILFFKNRIKFHERV